MLLDEHLLERDRRPGDVLRKRLARLGGGGSCLDREVHTEGHLEKLVLLMDFPPTGILSLSASLDFPWCQLCLHRPEPHFPGLSAFQVTSGQTTPLEGEPSVRCCTPS